MSGFRKYGRKTKSYVVEMFNDDLGEVVVHTKDVSKFGMFVQGQDLSKKIAVGDAVNARLFLDDNKESNESMRVVRTTQDGVAFSFD